MRKFAYIQKFVLGELGFTASKESWAVGDGKQQGAGKPQEKKGVGGHVLSLLY